MKQRRDLSDLAWTIEPTTGPIPAEARRRFPSDPRGCAHTDLIAAGVIPHPDHGDGEAAQTWIGRTDWRASCTFDLDDELRAADRIDLVFDELDTVAAVTLNDAVVGRAANMFRPHRFDVTDVVRAGGNQLTVDLRGPLAFAEAEAARLGPRPVNGEWGPYSHMRKSASSFGWDWGPRTPSVSVGPVRVEGWSSVRIIAVRPLIKEIDAATAHVDVTIDVDRIAHVADGHLTATLFTPDGAMAATGGAVCDRRTSVIPLRVLRPRRWFPIGVGEQPRYRLLVSLRMNGAWADQWSAKIGLRTVELDRDDGAFTVRVNGQPTFCRGANWIPPTLFPGRTRSDRALSLIDDAVAANMNMLRVWGGGRYEDDRFYERCDELGLLVWQDAMLACATYPEDDPFPDEMTAELEHAMARLARHPSVVVWCGGNENILAYQTWGWRDEMPADQPWGRRYFLEDFPTIATRTDPTRPFWPDSPYSGDESIHPNDPERGDRHTWDRRYDEFRADATRFASEFGCQGPPARRTLVDALGDDALVLGHPALALRQRGWGGDEHQYRELPEIFGPAKDFDAWHTQAQLFQARTLWMACGRYRMLQPRCMGALVWQLNDVWTGHTWSLTDAAGRRKPAWWAVRRAFSPRTAFWRRDDDGLRPVLVNDDRSTWRARVRMQRFDLDAGGVITDDAYDITVAARDRLIVDRHVDSPDDPRRFLDILDVGDARDVFAWTHDRHLINVGSALQVTDDAGATVLTAQTLIRELIIPADVVTDDVRLTNAIPQGATLLPGETLRLPDVDPALIEAALRPLRCADTVVSP